MRITKRFLGIAIAYSLVVAVIIFVPHGGDSAEAATASDFNPGYIISDAQFFNGDAMSAQQVQDFLNSKISSCRAGYTCLKDLTEVTASIPANPMCAAYPGGTLESAAAIISKVGRACGISQKAIIATLQKEQGLVTDTWPTASQYSAAMGALCPDTAPCDAGASGFFKQVYTGAYLFKRYTQPAGTGRGTAFESRFDLSYPVGAWSNIQISPNSACGSKSVFVQNQATHALYVYTPYTPNDAAMSNLYGVGDNCSAYGNRNFWRIFTDWFGPTTSDRDPLGPLGKFEKSVSGPNSARVSGWAFDPETAAPITIHAYLGGPYTSGGRWAGAFVADKYSSPVGLGYPSYGFGHGFEFTIDGLTAPTQVCLYAINVGNGTNTLIECPAIAPSSGAPTGNFEAASLNGLQLNLQGWALDPDTSSPVTVHVYLGGPYGTGSWGGAYLADASRKDVGNVYPLHGDLHGLNIPRIVGIGTTQVCLYAMDGQVAGLSTFLGCKSVSSQLGSPTGSVDVSRPVLGGGAIVSGWALDPETTNPVDVHIYVNGRWGGAFPANTSRPDVGAAYPGYGNNHGYEANLTGLTAGVNSVCIYAINTGVGTNPLLGCRDIVLRGGNPFGNIDAMTSTARDVSFSGWIIDPDVADPVKLHVYNNGRWVGEYSASAARPDVEAAYPGYGPNHGFQLNIPLNGGSNSVCIYAINQGSGTTNPLVSCRTLNAPGGNPFGTIDASSIQGSTAVFSGWSIDPDVSTPVRLHVYNNGAWVGEFVAGESRPDVGNAFPSYGPNHGYQLSVPLSPGVNNTCIYGINEGSGTTNPLIGCRTITSP